MMLGKISSYVRELINQQVQEHGIVVFYDPQKSYVALLDRLNLPGMAILSYNDTCNFFQLREKLEPFLEYVTEDGRINPDKLQPPHVLVHVPLARSGTAYALIESESAGAVMEPGAPDPDRNTRLGRIAETMFRELQPARAAQLERQADDGILTLEDLDRMADEAGPASGGTLGLVFGQASPFDILLTFLADPSIDAKLEEKKALPELVRMAVMETGFEVREAESPEAVRASLTRSILLADFVLSIPAGAVPESLADLPLSASPVHQDIIKGLCDHWRNRTDLKDSYVRAVASLDSVIGVGSLALPTEDMAGIMTFPSVDRRLLSFAIERIGSGEEVRAAALAKSRMASFWPIELPELWMRWALVDSAACLLLQARQIQEAVKGRTWQLPELVDAYARHTAPWMTLDRQERMLETRYALCEAEHTPDDDELDRLMVSCRTEYARTLDLQATSYGEALVAAGFKAVNAIPHREVFRTSVKPSLDDGAKTAFFIVDALRYEMAAELLDGLEKEFETRIEPVLGQLPGITSIGMAALMPGAETGLLLQEGTGRASVEIGSIAVTDRPGRIRWMSENAGVPVACYKLGEVTRLTPKRKREITAARLVVVTSQEIDRLGEGDAEEEETRGYMDDVLDKLRRAIRGLAAAGVERFCIAADHGYYFAEGLEPGYLMDSPGGAQAELHPRAWIGRGGVAGDGYQRLNASAVGLGGDLELAIPRCLGAFRVPGGAGPYYHGGATLQENLLPVCRLTRRGVTRKPAGCALKMSLARKTITSRFFSVTLGLTVTGLFDEGGRRVRLEVIAGDHEVGKAAVAAYGFEEGTREITMLPDKPNAVTVWLTASPAPGSVTIKAFDCETQVALDVLHDVPVDLMI